ncbi:arylsulfatase [Dactylosporangium roseum]|uniref:Arylsulfatase n=1 Tax=Dactylosporangium roseum TaxID=47989 RepID=A0ABY5YZC6_9ACTN|nr:arylsulfatase [Dactylosporangium roseum]UWZ34726.1 arylsulfatase [Dactylosporangium roseum]
MTQQRIGRTPAESRERWPELGGRSRAAGAPNVVVILLDDVGFAQYGCFGSTIQTPAIDRLAREGLRYVNFHTTAVCSPTRASLLTGRNCHAVGFGHVTERLAGYPGYSMRLPDSAATVAEILRGNGYTTWAVGKWHLTPSYETGPQGPFERWPLGRGFDRFYGFLGGSTDQYAPELVRDNTPVSPPRTAADGYHLSADLVDESIRQIRDLRAVAPNRPFMLYLATGCGHAPHQAPAEWIERYRGVFDAGWDAERDRVLARQIELGVMPPGTRLGPSNPGVPAWTDLTAEQRRLASRMMEVYAGFVSYTDAQIGRLLDALEATGDLDDTVVMLCSDNGASGEGGPEGSVDEGLYLNDRPQRTEDGLAHIDELGGPRLYNHYPWGWAQAGNTPFRWYKQFTHAGGITNGLLVRYPGGGAPAGGIRRQYHHVIDIAPTLLDLTGTAAPAAVRGVAQQPMHGVSMRYSFADADAPGHRHTQHYEMWGNRGIWQDGWMAVCRLQPDGAGAFPPQRPPATLDELRWELYDHRSDPSECDDLAEREPARLRAMTELWWAAAGRYDVLPVDNRARAERWPADPPAPPGSDPARARFHGPGGPYERGVAPRVAGRSFRMYAEVTIGDATAPGGRPRGVLYAVGGGHGGYCWYVQDGQIRFEVAQSSVQTETVAAPFVVAPGRHRLEVAVDAAADLSARIMFTVDGAAVGGGSVSRLLKRVPIGSGRTYVGHVMSSPVSGAFTAPNPFTGELHELVVLPGPPAGAAPAVQRETADAEMREQ